MKDLSKRRSDASNAYRGLDVHIDIPTLCSIGANPSALLTDRTVYQVTIVKPASDPTNTTVVITDLFPDNTEAHHRMTCT